MEPLTMLLSVLLPPILISLIYIHKVLLEIRSELRLKNYRADLKLNRERIHELQQQHYPWPEE